MRRREKQVFHSQSIIKIYFFSIISLGFYLIYYFYQIYKALNQKNGEIPSYFILFLPIIIQFISGLSLATDLISLKNEPIISALTTMSFIASLFAFYWSYRFNLAYVRIIKYERTSVWFALVFNIIPPLSFFYLAYLQRGINEYLEEESQKNYINS